MNSDIYLVDLIFMRTKQKHKAKKRFIHEPTALL